MYATIDIETTGLNRFEDKITMVGVGIAEDVDKPLRQKEFDFSIEGEELKFLALCEKLRRRNAKLIWQNGKFDTLFLKYRLDVSLPIHHDVMLMGTAYDLAAEHGLKAMAQRYLGVEDWDIDKKTKTGKGNSETLKAYLKLDVKYTWELFKFFNERMNKTHRKIYKKLLLPAYRMYRQTEQNGIYIDLEGLDKVREEYQEKEAETLAILQGKYNINWNSPQQVQDVFFNKEKFPTLKLSEKTGKPSADAKVMKKLASMGYELPKQLLDYKFYYGANTKFTTRWGEYAKYDGRIHPHFNITNVVTGRTSCSDPNLQQVPRNKALRSLFTAPPGRVFLEADYSQIELRVAAHYAQEPNMLKIYREGGDIHTETARTLCGGEPTKEERNKAKAVNFGFLYGMGAKGFVSYAFDSYGVVFTPDEAERYRDLFFQKYSRLLTWHDKMEQLCEANGGVSNLFGRFRALPKIYSQYKWERNEAVRRAINSPVQGTASDLLLCAAVQIAKELGPKYDLKIVGTVHDSILADVPEEYAEECVAEIRRIMAHPDALDEFGIEFSLPIDCDVGVGPWGTH
jgi:DNA polymerase-1